MEPCVRRADACRRCAFVHSRLQDSPLYWAQHRDPRTRAVRTGDGEERMEATRRSIIATGSAALAMAATAPHAFGRWEPSEKYPDPAVEVPDPRFATYRLVNAVVQRL